VLLFAQLATLMVFQSAIPFAPLFFRELGESEASAIVWTGTMSALASLVLVVVTPVWGALADQVGTKTIILRTMIGGILAFVLMGFAQAPWQILVLRTLQSLTGGVAVPILATIGARVPAGRLALGISLHQMAQSLGVSIGPLLGGFAMATWDWRTMLFLSAGMMAIGAGLVALLVKDAPKAPEKARPPLSASFHLAWRTPALRTPIFMVAAFQTGHSVSFSLLALHIAGLKGDHQAAATEAGLAITATAVGMILGAAACSTLADRIGASRLVLLGLFLTGALTLPQFWATDATQITVLRFLIGLTAGGLLPMLRTSMTQHANANPAAKELLGGLHGIAQTALFAGMGLGPALAAFVASFFGLPAVHLAAGGLLLAAAVGWAVLSSRTVGTTS
jgi:MFS family permease